MGLRRGTRLVIASHNEGKIREIAELFAPFGIEAVGAASLGLAEPEETGQSFAENAAIKAVAAAEASGMLALADEFRAGGSRSRRRSRHPFGALGGKGQGFRPSHAAGATRA